MVERLASENGIRIRSRESHARVGRGKVEGESVLLALPQTYMNASGEAVHALCERNDIDAPDLCVVFDDIDLPLGTLRMRARGSAGGQKGIRSIIADYVLEPFAKGESETFEDAIDRAVDALRVWIREGIDAAMRRANVKPSSPGPASDPD